MPVIVIRDPITHSVLSVQGSTRMYLYSESGSFSLSIPLAPRAISYTNFGNDWVETDRSGNTPLLLRKGAKLKQIQFSALITDKTLMLAPQGEQMNAIEALATTTERILVKYGPQEAGLWRVVDCSFDSELRHPDTNEVVRGTLSLTLKRANDAAPAVGPVSGGPAPAPTGPAPAPPPRTYTVVRGDCLWTIAQRYYGNGAAWPKIYDANRSKITKSPNLIYPGQVFVIP
jgi:hypothetical protein